MDPGETWVHEKEILTKQDIVINMLYLLYKRKCCMTISYLNGTKEILNNWLEKREFIGAGVCRF